ncbi:hypothetical protein VWZ82_12825 [Phaeobacter sp. JH20_41]|uniref:hypothetical protein n=1 Tax=Phaeobacter sp. JH20_41 TaxID=3112498 RepID=UPI003A865EEE
MTDTSKEAVESLIYDLKFEGWDYTSEVVRDLLSERDTLQASLTASEDNCQEYARDVKFALSEVRDYAAEVNALRAQLQAARDEALEEAAVVISDYRAFTKYNQDPLTNEIRENADGVKVKPLVWEYHPAGEMASDSVGKSYIVDTRGKRTTFLRWPQGFAPEINSLDDAKAAAQADYERRIKSVLED